MNKFNDVVESKPDDELLKTVYEFDLWSPEMLASVETELEKRNILPNDIQLRKQGVMESEKANLIEGKSASITGIVIGWITVFGLLGIIIGYNYSFSKIRDKYSGEQYFKYDKGSRKMGSYLFYSSIVFSTIVLLYRFMKSYAI